MANTVLLVEDNERINIANKYALEIMGYDVAVATRIAEARRLVPERMPDIVVLDIMLPDGSGIDYLRELRSAQPTANIPVIMLTALGSGDDVVNGLTTGADDYLAKPYEYKVLSARIEALLRRAANAPKRAVTCGPLKLDMFVSRAYMNGCDIGLTPKEFALLLLLAEQENKAVDAGILYEKAWGQPVYDDKGAVRRAISRLRNKLSGSGYTITSEYGGGYRFEKE